MERGRGATSRTRSNASPTVYPDILDATSSTGLERLQAFAAQQHPDPQMSKPRPRVGELPDPQPQRGLIPRPTAAIPGRSTELRQPTGPRRLRQLEDENARLKRLVADLTGDKHMLAEALRKHA